MTAATHASPLDSAGTRDAPVSRLDFRRATQLSRETVRGLSGAHEMFARRVASTWGATLRALVRLEPLSVDQVTYDDYIRSMPNPNVLGVVDLDPLPGPAVLEMDTPLALALVDRLLGGTGTGSAEARRPSELETMILTDVLSQATTALDEALAPLAPVTSKLSSVELNPQLVQVAAPSAAVLVLSFRLIASQGVDADGLVQLCYPATTLTPIMEQLQSRAMERQASQQAGPPPALAERLSDVGADVRIQLTPSPVPAADLASLRVGDVLRLDHRVDAPLQARIGDVDVLDGFVGRRGRRLAFQVRTWLVEPNAEQLAGRSS